MTTKKLSKDDKALQDAIIKMRRAMLAVDRRTERQLKTLDEHFKKRRRKINTERAARVDAIEKEYRETTEPIFRRQKA